MERDKAPQLLTPASVKTIISRVETAQLARAQEDISTQLSGILDNVNGVINRFQEDLGYDLKEKTKSYHTEQKGKKRFILLEKIASFSKDAKTKEKHLYEILHWLGDWVPKHIFWQGWREKSPQKSSPSPQPLSPEQMLQDKHATCTKVSEVTSMLQELLDSTMFNKGEVKAIRYMSTVVENLNKALILQQKENRNLEARYKCLQTEMAMELSTQRLHFQKSIQDLESERDALLRQIAILGGKCHDLVLTKHALEFQLKKIQIARGPAGDPAEVSLDFSAAPEEKTLPQTGAVMEEAPQEPREEEQLSSPLSSSPIATAWDSGVTPPTCQPLSTTSMHSGITDVFKDTEILESVLSPSENHQFPTRWERLEAESSAHKDKKQGDCFSEKERAQMKLHFRKHLSPESSGEVPLESPAGHWEEELVWQRRRQQRLQEEELWLQQQRKWALLEQEHQEKLRRWEMEAATSLQQQTLAWPEEGRWSLRREPVGPREDTKRPIFTTTGRWRNLEQAEPPPSRARSACQGRRPYLPRSSPPQQPGPGSQRIMSSTKCTQMPQASRIPTKPKKSASFPITGTSIRRVTRSSPQRPLVTPKDKVYHMDMEAQRKNLQLLSGGPKPGLPHYLHSKALELTTTTMELNARRLRYLCQKYVLYRHFQSLRQAVISHMQVMGKTRAISTAQRLQVLGNVDRQQRLRLQAWEDKQKDLEEKHRECLSSMVTIFPKLRLKWDIHLNIPVVVSSKPRKCKSPPTLSRRIHSSTPTCKRSFPPRHQECVPLWAVSQQGNQTEAIWKTDVASSSHPIEKKTPANLSWLGGYPDMPRLVALDEHSSHHGNLTSLTVCASETQRKECQEHREEPAELVCKTLSQSLPGTLQDQKE
ncbi:protein FAM186B isoform X2 [Octodon degus]|uniref:Protein FAM186B isoform X2 n=1 Tax=Octodon degus TaxID=10160 RepID=A0A6P6F2H3_OCTDE|nr:protein FAM186B isoform X2 [Octodon degus]